MTRYAAGTTVPVENSRAEIERILQRYGAQQFLYGWDQKGAVVGFTANARQIKFVLPLPDRQSPEFTEYKQGSKTFLRVETEAQRRWEQACRQRWRALALVIKAKLEAIESGISTFENEFLAHTVLPNGATVGQFIAPQIEEAYLTGKMPELLPGLPRGRG